MKKVVSTLFEEYKTIPNFSQVAYQRIREYAQSLGESKLKKLPEEGNGYRTSEHINTIQAYLIKLKRMFIDNNVRHEDYLTNLNIGGTSREDRKLRTKFKAMSLAEQLQYQKELIGMPPNMLSPDQYREWYNARVDQLPLFKRRIATMPLLPAEVDKLGLPPQDVEKLETFRKAVMDDTKTVFYEWTKMVEVLNMLLSPDVDHQLVGLMLATGRREVELSKLACLRRLKGNNTGVTFEALRRNAS